MAEGKLIVEVYEYSEDYSSMPKFEYIPCELSECIKHNNSATLKEIIQRGFETLPKKSRNPEKWREILQKLDEADISKINVMFNKPTATTEQSIELTNVIPVSLSAADARHASSKINGIILSGKYRLSDGTGTTVLKDAQRLSLIYSSQNEQTYFADPDADEPEEIDVQKEICLNITYMCD